MHPKNITRLVNGEINDQVISNAFLNKLYCDKYAVTAIEINDETFLPRCSSWIIFLKIGYTYFHFFKAHRPADKEVRNWSPLYWAVTAEGKARLAVDVLRVSHVRAVIAFINRHIYPGSSRMRLGEKHISINISTKYGLYAKVIHVI